jgi:hypothetical protein
LASESADCLRLLGKARAEARASPAAMRRSTGKPARADRVPARAAATAWAEKATR